MNFFFYLAIPWYNIHSFQTMSYISQERKVKLLSGSECLCVCVCFLFFHIGWWHGNSDLFRVLQMSVWYKIFFTPREYCKKWLVNIQKVDKVIEFLKCWYLIWSPGNITNMYIQGVTCCVLFPWTATLCHSWG